MQNDCPEPDAIRQRSIFLVEDLLEQDDATDLVPEIRNAAERLRAAAACAPWSKRAVAAARRLAKAMDTLAEGNPRRGQARHEAVEACRAVYGTMPSPFPALRRKAGIERV